MKTSIERESFENVMRKLNTEVRKIGKASMKGLVLAVADIRRRTETEQPLCPVGKTGNLHNSWTEQPFYYKNKAVVIYGYTADYALWVHEMYGAHFQREGAGAGWFTAAIKRGLTSGSLLNIIRKEIKAETKL